MSRINIGFVIGWLFIICGCLACAKQIQNMYWGLESRSWDSVEGVILKSTVRRVAVGHPRVEVIEYQYVVEGVVFTVGPVHLSNANVRGGVPGGADGVGQYSGGDSVRVYYNPSRPRQSVLRQGMPPYWLANIVVPIVLAGAGVLICLVIRKLSVGNRYGNIIEKL